MGASEPDSSPFTITLGIDPVVEAYKKDVDRTLLRENLKLTVDERFKQFESFMHYFYELRAAGLKMKESRGSRT